MFMTMTRYWELVDALFRSRGVGLYSVMGRIRVKFQDLWWGRVIAETPIRLLQNGSDKLKSAAEACEHGPD